MTDEIILANAQLVLEREVVTGGLRLVDGVIRDLHLGAAVGAGAVDCGGDYIAPGLIELHTDNLERHITPRPKVNWPHRAAIVAHDRELASTGITTVFDAIRVGSILSDVGRKRHRKYARAIANEILQLRAAGALAISHHIHLRAEVCTETLTEELDEFGPEDRVGIVSLMDHTPGQRQFTDLEKFESYVRGKHGMSEADFKGYIEFLYGLRQTYGAAHETAAVAAAERYGATLASHDDTTADQVATSAGYGIKMAEFPTTVEAAQACADHGIAVIMGAPNIVRGGSHSGNVAAMELAALDRLDILSSDYVPAGLLLGALQLADHWGDLARAMACVTRTPAQAVGLTDRGVLVEGQRADIIRFARLEGHPVLQGVWTAGRKVG